MKNEELRIKNEEVGRTIRPVFLFFTPHSSLFIGLAMLATGYFLPIPPATPLPLLDPPSHIRP